MEAHSWPASYLGGCICETGPNPKLCFCLPSWWTVVEFGPNWRENGYSSHQRHSGTWLKSGGRAILGISDGSKLGSQCRDSLSHPTSSGLLSMWSPQ
jgi:hypothetical protein